MSTQLADESPRSSDDRFYTPRASARTGGGNSSGDEQYRTPRTGLTARSDAEYYTPRGDVYDNSSSSDNEEFYSSRDQTADGSFPVMPMPFAHHHGGGGHHRSRSGSSSGFVGGMPPAHPGFTGSVPPTRPSQYPRGTPVAASTRVATFTVPSPRGGGAGPAFAATAAASAGSAAASSAAYSVSGVPGSSGSYDTASAAYATVRRPSITPHHGAGAVGASGGYSLGAPPAAVPSGGASNAVAAPAYSVGGGSYGVAAGAAAREYKAGGTAAAATDGSGGGGDGYHVVHGGGGAAGSDYSYGSGGKYAEEEYRGSSKTGSEGSGGAVAGLSGREIHDVWSLTRHNRYKEVQALLDKGLPVNVRDKHGNTILATACQNGLKRIAKIALRCGADINARNLKGNTPLHFCFAYGYGDTLGEYLISKGADCTIRNKAGLTCREGIERGHTPRR